MVDVLRQPTGDEVCAAESCAAEEVDVLVDPARQYGQQMRDRVITPYLLLGGTEAFDLTLQIFVA